MSPSVQHPALPMADRGGLATTADRPGQEGLPAGPLATGCWQLVPNICFFFTWSEGAPVTTSYRDHDATCSFGRSRADSRPQPVSMLTISHISRGNLGPAAPPAAHPAAASLRPIVQRHRCPRLQDLAPIFDLRQALSHPGDQRRIEGEGPGLAIARVVGAKSSRTTVGLGCPGFYTAPSLRWEGSRSRPRAA